MTVHINEVENYKVDKVIEIIIYATITFNAVLAFVNANVFRMSNSMVAVFDAMLILTSLYIVMTYGANKAKMWIVILLILIIFHLVVILKGQIFSLKYFRDVLVIPVFIGLGAVYSKDASKLIKNVIMLVLLGCLIELLFFDFYSELLNIKSYYVNTRGFQEEGFYTEESSLFVSAFRPGDRFIPLPFGEVHRLSSFFLEAVSLGNFAVFVSIFISAFWRELTQTDKYKYLIIWFALIALCDGRFAFACSLLVFTSGVLVRAGLGMLTYLVLPMIFLGSILLVSVLDLKPDDTFPGRISTTVNMLYELEPLSYLFGNSGSRVTLDSGYVYIINTQTVFSLLIIFMIILTARKMQTDLVYYKYQFGLAIYVAMNLMISCSIFSIKTAAIIFFFYGWLWKKNYVHKKI
jgi:putative polymerase